MNKNKIAIILSLVLIFSLNLFAQNSKKIVVEEIDKAKLEKLIKNRKGKVLLLNIWASWCPPCKKEFPDLVKLAEKYKNSKVDIVGLSVDDKSDLNSEVIPFLQKNEVNFKIYIQNFKSIEELISFFPKWEGAIPLTVIFDKNGNEKKFIIGMRDFEFFDKAIQEVLASK
ncbi:MAG: TlpA disulfide reductase family protein [Ignavibacteria bacterium]|jgi:thiol-disulfide isomerase/thioredoxin|nr:TlpA family protein disulfide reductase [Ignavibacteria bacterium]MDH7527779.1 TlpA disulfide reductase family protein [Ignavibacteria bacterium]NPV11015.1 TlpA family protein disulfide reductase [Ignavibacteria bacterium]